MSRRFATLVRAAPFAILALAAMLRLLGLNKGIWLDEFSSISIAQADPFWPALASYDHPPLYFLLLRGWCSVNNAESFLRLPSVLCGVATVIVLMRWLRPRSVLRVCSPGCC